MTDLPGIVLLSMRIGLVICLYSFLTWAFVSLWRDLQYGSTFATQAFIPEIKLISKTPAAFEQSFSVSHIYLGRDPVCECYLENDTVSQRHALIAFHHNQWWLEDLNSRNGTFLNDKPLETPAVLTSNDLIRCGNVIVSVVLDP